MTMIANAKDWSNLNKCRVKAEFILMLNTLISSGLGAKALDNFISLTEEDPNEDCNMKKNLLN